MRLVLVLLLLWMPATAQAVELKSIDLETQTMGDLSVWGERLQVRPTATFGITHDLDFQVGGIYRERFDNDDRYGIYTKIQWRPPSRHKESRQAPPLTEVPPEPHIPGITELLEP